MNPVTVFLPHILAGVGILVFVFLVTVVWFIVIGIGVVALFHVLSPDGRMRPQKVAGLHEEQWRHLLFWPSLFLLFLFCAALFLKLAGFWLKTTPSQDWQQQLATADATLVFGFGLVTDEQGHNQAGAANRFLIDWLENHTNKGMLLVQEGVLAATKEASHASKLAGREIHRMHGHDQNVYIDTLGAAYCALEQMERRGAKRALVVAHDLQLARAAADLRRVANANPRWREMEFIIPDVPPTPFVPDSAQWHTHDAYRYSSIELFISRPRDIFFPLPQNCKMPIR